MRLLPQRVFAVMKSTQSYLLAFIAVSVLISQPARAGSVVGQVGVIEAIGSGAGAPGNFDFRVFLATSAVICNGQNWVYINIGDANYNVLVAFALSAKSLGSTVTLYFNQVGSYCQLTYMLVS
jgi:hypothetical protein